MKKKCSLCGVNEASMKLRQMDKDGKVSELDICAECAQKRGFSDVDAIKMNVAEILAEIKSKVADEDKEIVCATCGMSFADFKRRGRFGCADCYQSFGPKLESLVRRLQGAVQHVGKTTKSGRKRARDRMSEQRLREDLRAAIGKEDYERAAELRDQLKQPGSDAAS